MTGPASLPDDFPPVGREARIRKRILLPLFIALLVSAAITVAASLRIHHLHIAREAGHRLQGVQTLLPALLKKDAAVLTALLDGLTGCPHFRRAWQSRDRDAFRDRVAPFFAELVTKQGIIELSFFHPGRSPFLHLQKDGTVGSGTADHTLVRTEQSGGTEHGLEIDETGTLSLRLTRPLNLDGQVAGFVRMKRDIHGLAATIKQATGCDVWFVADKGKLDRQRWLQGAGPAGTEDWARFSQAVVIAGSVPGPPPALASFIDRPHSGHSEQIFTTMDQGWTLQGGHSSLFDTDGHEIGRIFFLEDASDLVAGLSRLRLLFLGALGLTAAGIFLFLHYYLGRIQTSLTDRRAALLSEIDTRRQAETALLRLKEDLEGLVTERTAALAGANQSLREEVEERQRAEQEWEMTFNAMSDIVTLQDQDMRILRANRAAGDFFRTAARELVGRRCYEVFRGLDEPCAGCPEMLAKASHRRETAVIEHCNLNRTLLVSASPIIDSDGSCRGLVHVARDITAQKKIEAQIQQTRKMEAVGTLAAGVAHDFNNIITGILGYGGLVLREVETDPALRQDIDQIIELGKRGADLTRQLLIFSRKQPMETSLLDLNALTENLMKMLGRLLGSDIEFEFVPAPDLAPVKGDPGQMEQVLVNLAVNARDAMPAGGILTVETANVLLDSGHAGRHPGMAPGSYVMLAVSDTGTGMDHETQQHIFEPFFTTKEAGQGTGLGLATVYGIVQQHRGSILVYSEPCYGTLFKVFLPRAEDGAESTEQTDQVGADFPGGRETILLAEDAEAVRSTLLRTLEGLGYTVLAVANPTQAAELLAGRPDTTIDLLFTDMVMPGGNGLELYRRLAGRFPGLKVLFMSGYNETIMQWKEMNPAGMPFLQKPFTMAGVARKIREVLDE